MTNIVQGSSAAPIPTVGSERRIANAWNWGVKACRRWHGRYCPYPIATEERRAWLDGYDWAEERIEAALTVSDAALRRWMEREEVSETR